MRNGNFLKIRVSEIRVKRIRVNQGIGVVSAESIQGRKLFKGGNYSRKYGMKVQLCAAETI